MNLKVEQGRREMDRHQHIMIHPVIASCVGGALLILLSIIGYLSKGFAENIMKELHELRLVAEHQLEESAKNNERWENMSTWKDDVDGHLHELDYRVEGQQLPPWSKKTREKRSAKLTGASHKREENKEEAR